MKPGRIALVGSGEYLPVMQQFENDLISRGPSMKYVQLATAAGRETQTRIQYWERIGKEQAERIGAEHVFLPVFNREDAMREDLAQQIDNAGLIYLSGGDPHHLAASLIGTPVWEAIERNWRNGSSLAGCSAGAMALGPDIPNFRKMKEEGSTGLGLLSNIRVIPHYNKFFGWIPDAAAQLFLKAPEHIRIIGIDEDTAMWSDDLHSWTVFGKGATHVLTGEITGKYHSPESVQLNFM
jgi:cyanophycinase-like exopeptidase